MEGADGRPGDRQPGSTEAGRIDEDGRDGVTTEVVGSGAGTSDSGDPPGAEAGPQCSEAEDIAEQRAAIRFNALRNALYHSARQRFYEFFHRWLMFGIVITGTAGVAKFLEKQIGDQLFAAATALLAALDLVLDLRGKAQLHDSLKRRYFEVLAKIDEDPAASRSQLHRWQAKLMKITADEPVTFRTVDSVAYNEAVDATDGYLPEHRLVIGYWRHLFRHWSTAQGVHFINRREFEVARAAVLKIRRERRKRRLRQLRFWQRKA